MINLVKRKISKKKRNKILKKINLNFFSQISPKIIKIFFLLVFLLGVVFAVYYIFQKTLFSQDNIIQNVNYNVESVKVFDEPYLYKKISELLKGKNYYTSKFLKENKILKEVSVDFPIIEHISIDYLGKNTVSVEVIFQKPNIIIKNQDLNFGIFQGYIFQIYSGNTIGNGVKKIYLPNYLSGINSIEGIFYDISFDVFIEQMEFLFKSFPDNKRIVYLPGGQRTIVELEDKRIHVNNVKDIQIQIQNFELLKKYYGKFETLKEIDLGSLEDNKLISK